MILTILLYNKSINTIKKEIKTDNSEYYFNKQIDKIIVISVLLSISLTLLISTLSILYL